MAFALQAAGVSVTGSMTPNTISPGLLQKIGSRDRLQAVLWGIRTGTVNVEFRINVWHFGILCKTGGRCDTVMS